MWTISWLLYFHEKWLSIAKLKARSEALAQKSKFEIFWHEASLRAFSFAALSHFSWTKRPTNWSLYPQGLTNAGKVDQNWEFVKLWREASRRAISFASLRNELYLDISVNEGFVVYVFDTWYHLVWKKKWTFNKLIFNYRQASRRFSWWIADRRS